jgi:ankyrin repeat protein
MIAVAEGHVSTALILLQAGARPNITNTQGRSALMFAAWYHNNELVAMLLKAGADPNIIPTDTDGMTALIASTRKGYKDTVDILLKGGADLNIKDRHGKSALGYANSDIAQLLKQAGGKD